MDTKLSDLYESILRGTNKAPITEEVVGKDIKGDIEGADKAKTKATETNKNVKVDKPVEGASSDDESAKPKELKGKKAKPTESKEVEPIKLSFDDLYNQTINEEGELSDDVVAAPDVEGSEFDAEQGDFGGGEEGEGDVDEEVDLSTELGLIADRLLEIKSKLMGEVEGEPEGEEPTEELETEGEPEGELGGSFKESIQSAPTPKPLKKTTLGPKTTQVPKNTIGTSGKGKANPATLKKDYSGKPSNAKKTTLGPKMSQTVTGKGPITAGKNEAFVK